MSEQWVDAGAVDAVSETEPLSVEVDGYSVIVLRCGSDFLAVEDRCTHDGEPLTGAEVEDCQIILPPTRGALLPENRRSAHAARL